MIKYLLFAICVIIGYIVIFALLRAASDFDYEVEELYDNFDCYEDDGQDEEFDYYDEQYKSRTNKTDE